ncbi:MAG: hypothetical protein ACJ741_11605 [Pyrinomonadaceae bacterium]
MNMIIHRLLSSTISIMLFALVPFGCARQMSQGTPPIGIKRGSNIPPPHVASDCRQKATPHEFPNDRFRRKGGRTTQVAVVNGGGMLSTVGVEQGRNLAAYERLNLINPKPLFASEEGQDDTVVRAREFIWQHWSEHHAGYLTVTLSSVDATSTAHIFIEQEDGGRWRVAWRWVRHTSEVDDLPTYYAVEWVVPQRWDEPGKPLSKGEQPDPHKHRLGFRDTCGDLENSF